MSDASAPDALHMAVLRSPYAHARIEGIDASKARQLQGVVGVFTPDDLGPIMKPLPIAVPDPRLEPDLPTPLATDVVRYVGEPVAVVVAQDRYLAEDALDLISVKYTALPVVTDPEKEGNAVLHAGRSSNLAATLTYRVGDPDLAFQKAAVVVDVTLRMSRVVAHPMEPRGIFVTPGPEGSLDVLSATQGPHSLKRTLSEALGMSPEKIRVRTPDIGGGFGVKNRIYQEDLLAAYLALTLGRPVKWAGDRREEFLATNQERDQIHRASLALDKDGHILAAKNHFIHDTGAYTTAGLIVPDTTCVCLPGPYRVPSLDIVGKVFVTNKAPVGPYRGAGRPQAAFVMERLMDKAADAMGLERVEIRRRNLITRQEMPYTTGVPGRGGAPMTYDDGDYPATMEAVLEAIGYDRFKKRQPQPGQGLLGMGIANYVEMASGAGFEDARLTLEPGGQVTVRIGISSQGQGHQTMIAQIAGERLGVPMDQIRVIEGDTGEISRGIGTFGSRSTIMAGNAVSLVALAMKERVLQSAGEILETAPDDLLLEDGVISIKGVPDRRLTLADLVKEKGPLEEQASFEGVRSTYGMGCHGAVVEIDPKTFQIRIKDYVICHDSGVVVNPLLADGQVIGGTVQGLGTALFEALDMDASGQPRNATFMDYLLPLAADMPDFRLFEKDFRATTNPEGVKGLAEGGTIPAAAVIVSAVEDALRKWGIQVTTIPVTPNSLFASIQQAEEASQQ